MVRFKMLERYTQLARVVAHCTPLVPYTGLPQRPMRWTKKPSKLSLVFDFPRTKIRPALSNDNYRYKMVPTKHQIPWFHRPKHVLGP